jgi:Mg-chelatase subunit ChlD
MLHRWVLVWFALAGCSVMPAATLSTSGLAKAKLSIESSLTLSGQLKVTADAWARLSTTTGGLALHSRGASDVPTLITEVLDRSVEPGAPLDLTFVVDTTGSMADDIDAVKAQMHEILTHLSARNPDHRVGVVAYRDRGDDYVSTLVLSMSSDDAAAHAAISSLTVCCGGDLREHVYAGLTTALDEQSWRPYASQHIILMGDAPPHDDYADDPRTYESVIALAGAAPRSVRIDTIGVQCDTVCQGLLAAGL